MLMRYTLMQKIRMYEKNQQNAIKRSKNKANIYIYIYKNVRSHKIETQFSDQKKTNRWISIDFSKRQPLESI